MHALVRVDPYLTRTGPDSAPLRPALNMPAHTGSTYRGHVRANEHDQDGLRPDPNRDDTVAGTIRTPLSSDDVQEILYVNEPQSVDGVPPPYLSMSTRIVSCTVLTRPSTPIRVGSRVVLVVVRHDPRNHSTATFVPQRTLAIGTVTNILIIEVHTVTFAVHNTRFPESNVAFAHVTVEYRQRETFHLDPWARLSRVILRRYLPETRLTPVFRKYIITEADTIHANHSSLATAALHSQLEPAAHSAERRVPTATYPPLPIPSRRIHVLSNGTNSFREYSASSPTTPTLSPTTPCTSTSAVPLLQNEQEDGHCDTPLREHTQHHADNDEQQEERGWIEYDAADSESHDERTVRAIRQELHLHDDVVIKRARSDDDHVEAQSLASIYSESQDIVHSPHASDNDRNSSRTPCPSTLTSTYGHRRTQPLASNEHAFVPPRRYDSSVSPAAVNYRGRTTQTRN